MINQLILDELGTSLVTYCYNYLVDATSIDIQMRVVGGIVSPSHPTLVRQRHRVRAAEIIPPKHRLFMARAAIGEGRYVGCAI